MAWLALLPVCLTALYYVLPLSVQRWPIALFLPQAFSYLGLAVWIRYNTDIVERMGLTPRLLSQGLQWGSVTGMLLGLVNTAVILWIVPRLGGDIDFLRETPHAKIPTLLMVPWMIVAIAGAVELNFRGFLLGRLVALFDSSTLGQPFRARGLMSKGKAAAVGCSALVFAFDPFLVTTFKHLHWIATWDGLIWGWMWIRLRNLYAVITAHAVEVIIMYLTVKAVLT